MRDHDRGPPAEGRALPRGHDHRTLVSEIATEARIIDACAHFELPCQRGDMALARARLAIHFLGAAQPEGKPKWLTDLSGLFRRQRWKKSILVTQWAEAFFGPRWVQPSKIAAAISKASSLVLRDNNIEHDYEDVSSPAAAPFVPSADGPCFNIIDCFSKLLVRDVWVGTPMLRQKYSDPIKTTWIRDNYVSPGLAELGITAGDALWSQEEWRFRKAFRPEWVLKQDYHKITLALDFENIKVSDYKEEGRIARLFPWGIVLAGRNVDLSIDLLATFVATVSRIH